MATVGIFTVMGSDPRTPQERFIATLTLHNLVEIRCDHEAKTDTPVCNCAVVALGTHPTVQAAKEAWATHVWEALHNPLPTQSLGGRDASGEGPMALPPENPLTTPVERCWLEPLTEAERAAIQRRVDAQTHPEDQTAALNEWWEDFQIRAGLKS